MPIMEYGDIVWEDKSNVTLMDKVQILQNKLQQRLYLINPCILQQLKLYINLDGKLHMRCQYHRLRFIYKIMNGLIDWDFKFIYFRNIHSYNMYTTKIICLPKLRMSCGRCRSVHHVIVEWDSLPENIRNASFFATFSSVTGGGQGATRPPPKISSEKFALSGITEMVISYFTR